MGSLLQQLPQQLGAGRRQGPRQALPQPAGDGPVGLSGGSKHPCGGGLGGWWWQWSTRGSAKPSSPSKFWPLCAPADPVLEGEGGVQTYFFLKLRKSSRTYCPQSWLARPRKRGSSCPIRWRWVTEGGSQRAGRGLCEGFRGGRGAVPTAYLAIQAGGGVLGRAALPPDFLGSVVYLGKEGVGDAGVPPCQLKHVPGVGKPSLSQRYPSQTIWRTSGEEWVGTQVAAGAAHLLACRAPSSLQTCSFVGLGASGSSGAGAGGSDEMQK